MMRRIAASCLTVLALACFVAGAYAGFVGIDLIQKPAGTGLTPYSNNGNGQPGVWKVWPAATTATDTTGTYSVYCRDARRVVWTIQGTGPATAPCSLLTCYVSNNDSAWVDASSVGMTVNDNVTGANIDTSSAAAGTVTAAAGQAYGANGRHVELTIGGVSRITWNLTKLVLTRKKGLAGAADSVRVGTRVQMD